MASRQCADISRLQVVYLHVQFKQARPIPEFGAMIHIIAPLPTASDILCYLEDVF